MQGRILICEDEKNIVSFLVSELEREGYRASAAFDGQSAIDLFTGGSFDLVLLDLMLPAKSGLEVLREIRKASDVPVIMLTARKDTLDKVVLLKAGADDYVTKPFDTMELIARIGRNIERGKNNRQVAIRGLSADYDSYCASVSGIGLSLSKTEFEILFLLLKNCGRVLTRDEILRSLYGGFTGESNVVDVNVKNIRKKLAEHSGDVFIETVRGKGYVIRP